MASRKGSYSPFKDGEMVVLKDGRSGKITAQRHAHHDIEVEIEGVTEWLKWEDVVREHASSGFGISQITAILNGPNARR